MNRWMISGILVTAALVMPGCRQAAATRDTNATSPTLQGTPTNAEAAPPTTGPAADRAAAASTWPFRPAALRFHPLTRLVPDAPEGKPVIEARLEFTDRAGDTTKAFGLLTVQLQELDARVDSLRTSWDNLDLTNLETNRTYYDVVTRTYLIRLVVDPAAMPETPELIAKYVGDRGTVMETRLELRR